MTSKIMDIARYTNTLLYNLGGCKEEYERVEKATKNLDEAVKTIQNMKWEYLFAVGNENSQVLTTYQQKVVECYATLKRELLMVYKEIFQQVKEI